MTLLHPKRLLLGLAAFFLIASTAVVYWSIAPLDSNAIDPSNSGLGSLRIAEDAVSKRPPIASSLASRTLRGPMVDAPRPRISEPTEIKPPPMSQPIVKPKRESGPKFKLVGTVVDAKSPVAILVDSQGKTDAKGVGDSLDLIPQGVTIESIRAQQVTLRYQGKPTVVSLDKSAVTTSGAGPTATKRRVGGRGRGR